MRRCTAVLSIALVTVALVPSARAQVPQLINFQAQVDGLSAATASVTFTLYDAPTEGTVLWTESYPSLPVQSGRIQALLGTNTPIDAALFEGDGERYLAVTVNGEVLLPRSRLTSVAYAHRAAVADRVLGSGSAGVASLNTLTGAITLEGGENVSITPDGQTLRIDAAGGIVGGGGITTINAGAGITVSDSDGPTTEIGLAPDAITDAYVADNSLGATSLADNAVGSAEIAAGAVGSSELSADITLGPGGRLRLTDPGGSARVDVTMQSGAGFLGLNAADGEDAVTLDTESGAWGRLTAHNANGVKGARIWGELTGADSETADQLTGGSVATFKKNGNNSTVWIRSNGTNASDTWGVIGISDAANAETIRLSGRNGDITASGNLSVAGTLTKGAGSFRIDHPLDPANKYLSHSFVESPDMMNIYNGNVLLDENGEAWVELPEWFESLNRDFRYQLTCIGGGAPVYIAEEIAENRFKIGGGTPGLKVSWQVTGIRQDPYAETHPIQVETDKPPALRGTYMHPDAYGVDNP